MGFLSVSTLLLAILDWKLSLGWVVGWSCLLLLSSYRESFYRLLLSEATFSAQRYLAYILFVFVILALPLLLAFLLPQFINPYGIVAAYLMDRFSLYIRGIFTRERGV